MADFEVLYGANFSGSPEFDRYIAYNAFDVSAIIEGRRQDKLTIEEVENTIDVIFAAANSGNICARALIHIAGYQQIIISQAEYKGAFADTTNTEALTAYELSRHNDPTSPIADELDAISYLERDDVDVAHVVST